MSLTCDAWELLAEMIRGTQHDPEKGTRGRRLRAIHDEADRKYRLSVPIAEAGPDELARAVRSREGAPHYLLDVEQTVWRLGTIRALPC